MKALHTEKAISSRVTQASREYKDLDEQGIGKMVAEFVEDPSVNLEQQTRWDVFSKNNMETVASGDPRGPEGWAGSSFI